MANKIALVTNGRYDELRVAAAFSPGHLLKIDTAGKALKHSTAGGRGERIFAEEDALQGRTITDAYDTTANDLASVRHSVPGDIMNVFLKAGEDVAIGAELVSAGDGTLQAAGSLASAGLNLQTVGYALDALDLSASGTVDTLVRVRIV